MIPSAPLFHFPDAQLNKIIPNMRHRPTWDGEIDTADIWSLKNVVWWACYFHTNSIATMTAAHAFYKFNSSNGTQVFDLVEIVFPADA